MGGGDKGLLDLAGKPMLPHVIDRLRAQVGRITINANGDPARFAAFGLPVIPDTVDGFVGPLAGVLAGMRWSAAQRTRGALDCNRRRRRAACSPPTSSPAGKGRRAGATRPSRSPSRTASCIR